ncbi:MAG: DNA-processing protein DprA [Burkholderiaceae bacterium]|nr:DNA-processing protein DprA [Burkholderiaceae bacterium]
MDADERAAWLRLALTPGLGPRTARALLSTFGLPQQVFAASAAALRQAVPEALAATLAAPPEAALARTIDAAEQWLGAAPNRFLLTLADADYPPLLLASHDPPPLLFAEGRRALLATPTLAIVGSRSCTRQGEATAEAFAQALTRAGLTIVSGLASGIDAAAHRGALRAAADGAPASTIAVVGTGIDRVYPAAHRRLAEQIRAHGLLLSEFALGAPALAHTFPRRNRILAALARGVLVVEAALHSGSLITARIAAELGREVFAIPGSIHAPTARGCHRLIKDGAKLVESAADILEELRLPASATAGAVAAAGAAAGADDLTPPLRALLALMGHDPVDVDTLAARSGLDTGHLTAALFELELAQHVERLPGNRYQRLR